MTKLENSREDKNMFVITEQAGRTIFLIEGNDKTKIKVLTIEKNRIKIAVRAPKHIEVYRIEVYRKRQAELSQQLEAYYYQNAVSPINHGYLKLSEIKAQPQKILLIEDNVMINKAHQALLTSQGYVVDTAENGEQALERFEHSYDLILLDIGLPDMSGLEVCRGIRQKEAEKRKEKEYLRTPIIILTTTGHEMKEKCLEAGADEFRVKPLSLENLQLIIRRWLSNDLAKKTERGN